MANRTAWTAGNGVGFTWTAAINSGDMSTLTTAGTSLGTPTISNQTNLDMFADFSVRCAIASSTIAAGANIALWLYALLDDGTTYGDGQLSVGANASKTPTFPPFGTVPLVAAAAQTTLVGFVQQVIIPPGTFKVALQNNSGFTFSGTQTCMYRTYNLNLNN
jgi:hypothetical protein